MGKTGFRLVNCDERWLLEEPQSATSFIGLGLPNTSNPIFDSPLRTKWPFRSCLQLLSSKRPVAHCCHRSYPQQTEASRATWANLREFQGFFCRMDSCESQVHGGIVLPSQSRS